METHPENYEPSLRAFVGHSCGFGAKYFGGWSRSANNTNFALAASRSLEKIKPYLKGVVFSSLDYRELRPVKKSLLYFDPPYADLNTGYRLRNFNVKEFWSHVRTIKGHLVYISQYEAPKDFYEVWQKVKQTVHNNRLGGSFATERLFVNEETFKFLTK